MNLSFACGAGVKEMLAAIHLWKAGMNLWKVGINFSKPCEKQRNQFMIVIQNVYCIIWVLPHSL